MSSRKRNLGKSQPKGRALDPYNQRAKREGFVARSVYKLEEIDKRYQVLKSGMRVLDLGASPGSWSQYAASKVGPRGEVFGIDILPARVQLPPHARIEALDVYNFPLQEFAGRFDVVLSDMAPNTSGDRSTDQYRSFELFSRALEIAAVALKPGGDFVGKIFQGPDFQSAKRRALELFESVEVTRPKATRKESYELFFIGKTLK